MLPESAAKWWMISAVTILVFCLFFLLVGMIRMRRKRKGALKMPSSMADSSITQELPVAAVQASLRSLRTLEEIVFCESREIIP